jgi:hypothetical protein
MPSSYSPSLRIELIAPGEQAGTWGTTTNTNLGTLVEDAISGYVSVAVSSANQALTALNGAADQSRNAIINLTTSTSADFAIYAPPESKQYTIKNASAYTATIYNSTSLGNTTAAGTGMEIPAGKTMAVWSDGTNFAPQSNQLASSAAGTTQTFGTNNNLVATTAFVQTALQALHPVGSIYINATNNTNPGTLLGFGTWTAFGAGRVPVGFNAADPLFDTAEETGGSKDAIVVSHTHGATSTSVVTDPGHTHTMLSKTEATAGGGQVPRYDGVGSITNTQAIQTATTGITVATSTVNASAGTSGTNANLQPYITVYMWKRTA